MVRLRKNIVALSISLAACIANSPRPVFASTQNASYQDIWAVSGGGIFNNVDLLRLDSNGTLHISSSTAGDLTVFYSTGPESSFGSDYYAFPPVTGVNTVFPGASIIFNSTGSSTTGIAVSTNVSIIGQGVINYVFMVGAVAPSTGSVICATTTASTSSGVTGAVCQGTTGVVSWIGISAITSSTNTYVPVWTYGYVLALATGTVNPGDVIVSSGPATNGAVGGTTSPGAGASIGVALGSNTSGSAGLVRIRMR